MTVIKKTITSVDVDVEKLKPFYIAAGNVQRQPLWKHGTMI